ncbi:MAG: hypothetical protein NXH75_01450 [Halobacteriovoraceae bacterium]|nr:hypothetical protein [Halobacteriovoraceae bacterium]
MRIVLFAICLFLSGCAGNVKILGRGCQTFNAEFVDINKGFNPSKAWQRKVWTSGGASQKPTTLTIREILDEKEIECKSVKSIRYSIGQSFWDQIFSLVPYIQRMTLSVEVETKG